MSIKDFQNPIIEAAVIGGEPAGNIACIKCRPGMANAVAATIDLANTPIHVVGTLAGDDTVFVLVKTEKEAEEFCKYFEE